MSVQASLVQVMSGQCRFGHVRSVCAKSSHVKSVWLVRSG